jgi:flagellar motility protein MotE (MotC chaperone)
MTYIGRSIAPIHKACITTALHPKHHKPLHLGTLLAYQQTTMPIPLYTSEKPSTSETAPPPEHERETKSPESAEQTCGSPHSAAAQDELARTYARRMSNDAREQTAEEREAAMRLYEERIEEEYAKREGGA